MNTPVPAAASVPAPAELPPRTRYTVQFNGTGSEYFRIWIVNVALTVVTLGIYSAWAKVRNKRYFYGNTRLAGGTFEYTANPVSILKGRIIVFGVFVAYQLAATLQPLLALGVAVAVIPLVPWVVIKAVSFNLRYSSYRGLRFHFDGTYWEAFRVYLLWTLATIASFGLAYPFVAWRRKQFLVERSRFGRARFEFSGEVGWFYVVYIVGSIAFGGVMVVGMLLLFGGAALTAAWGVDESDLGQAGAGVAVAVAVLLYAMMPLLLIVFGTGMQAMIANHVWQRSRLSDVRFDLRLDLWRVAWIQASNIVAIIASVGLLIPWARVRMIRYRLSCFALLATPQALDSFLASERDRVEATGAEMGEALDLDLGL